MTGSPSGVPIAVSKGYVCWVHLVNRYYYSFFLLLINCAAHSISNSFKVSLGEGNLKFEAKPRILTPHPN